MAPAALMHDCREPRLSWGAGPMEGGVLTAVGEVVCRPCNGAVEDMVVWL
jgi:hypothetical protein